MCSAGLTIQKLQQIRNLTTPTQTPGIKDLNAANKNKFNTDTAQVGRITWGSFLGCDWSLTNPHSNLRGSDQSQLRKVPE